MLPSRQLMGMHRGAATLGNSLAASYEVKPAPTPQTSHRTLIYPETCLLISRAALFTVFKR